MADGLNRISSKVSDALTKMVATPNFLPGYLNSVVMRQYQQAQVTRWQKNNDSWEFSGGRWDELSPEYAAWKARKYGTRQIMIRTKNLYDATINPRKVVDDSSIYLYVDDISYKDDVTKQKERTTDYAGYASQRRPIDTWSREFKSNLVKGYLKYVRSKWQ